jgi:tRNA-splicing ligase RtcB
MTSKDLFKLGFKPSRSLGVALRLLPELSKSFDEEYLKRELKAVLDDPIRNATHPQFSEVAQAIREEQEAPPYIERPDPAPFQIWGENLEPTAVDQIKAASRLPVAVRGALMPDAHLGYGLPIGGVLATANAVIPYAVGVDIACRMKLSVYDIPADDLARLDTQLTKALQRETLFGTGQAFKKPHEHEVLEADWIASPITAKIFETARGQLGSCGSGNHFVEFGIVT